MKRHMIAGAVVMSLLASARPVRAQVVVIDPAVLAKTISIIAILYQHYQTVTQTYEKVTEIAAGMPGMDRYNLKPFEVGLHDLSRVTYGTPFLTALDYGDPRGELYEQVIAAIPRARLAVLSLPVGSPERRDMENAIAKIEITDSIMQRGLHQVGAIRGWSVSSTKAIANLVADVLNARTAYHNPSAILDKLNGASVIQSEQNMADNQLSSHQLELILDEQVRYRDAMAATLNWNAADRLYGQDAGADFVKSWPAIIREGINR